MYVSLDWKAARGGEGPDLKCPYFLSQFIIKLVSSLQKFQDVKDETAKDISRVLDCSLFGINSSGGAPLKSPATQGIHNSNVVTNPTLICVQWYGRAAPISRKFNGLEKVQAPNTNSWATMFVVVVVVVVVVVSLGFAFFWCYDWTNSFSDTKSMPCVHSSMFFPNRPLNRSITFFLSSLEPIHHKKIRKYQSLYSSFVSKLLLTMDNVNHIFRFCWLS